MFKLISLSTIFLLSAPIAHAGDVIPAPARVAFHEGVFAVRARTPISVPRDPNAARIANYLADLLARTRGLNLRIAERSNPASAPDGAVVLRLDSPSADSSPESYTVEVSPHQVILAAGDPRGLLYAAVTLWELSTASAGSGPVSIPAQSITDSPRFPWRGLMLDSARHFQSPRFVMQLLDWMALHKLNVLHWHLTDDQAWRLEIKRYPRLTQVGARRVPAGDAAAADMDPATGKPRLYGGFYTQDEVHRIVAHAANRNVTIVPELDMPGHATAAIVAYPELGVTEHPPTVMPSDWGVYPNLYNVEDGTFTFLENVLDEIMALFPGQYLHVGGDEAVKDQWRASPRVQERMHALHITDEAHLQSYFVQRIEQYVSAHGRRVIGWDEILEGGIAPNTTIMSWRGLDGAIAAAQAGHDAVLTPQPTLYFDNRQGSGSDEPPGRGQIISLHDVYAFDPGHDSHILGVQGNIWTEHMRTEDRVTYMTFPRAAAVAEVGWSQPEQHDWQGFVQRLPAQFARYRSVGLLRYSDDVERKPHRPGPFERHASQDLRPCTQKLLLNLEDDAPVRGPRAVFLMDIMNPCWIFPAADLARGPALRVSVGQVPFNFQIGKDRDNIKLASPRTPSGELEVFLDHCDGQYVAALPLAPAVGNNAVTELPAAALPRKAGRHDLCFRFTQRTLDPMWALNSVQLRE